MRDREGERIKERERIRESERQRDNKKERERYTKRAGEMSLPSSSHSQGGSWEIR